MLFITPIKHLFAKVASGTGNAGIGLETVRGLAATGMTVILACRNLSKGERTAQLLLEEKREKETGM